jgi:hypothetical protein
MPYTVPRMLHNYLSRNYVNWGRATPWTWPWKQQKSIQTPSHVLKSIAMQLGRSCSTRHDSSCSVTTIAFHLSPSFRTWVCDTQREAGSFQMSLDTQILTDSSLGVSKPLMALIVNVSLGYAAVLLGTRVTTPSGGTVTREAAGSPETSEHFHQTVQSHTPECTYLQLLITRLHLPLPAPLYLYPF